MRSCVRPLAQDPYPLAQMGSASDLQTTGRHVIATGKSGVRRSSVRPIAISCFALKPSAAARGSSGDRRTPIRFSTRHHRPDNPGHLVGQSHRRELARLAFQQLQSHAEADWRPGGEICVWMVMIVAIPRLCRRLHVPAAVGLLIVSHCLPLFKPLGQARDYDGKRSEKTEYADRSSRNTRTAIFGSLTRRRNRFNMPVTISDRPPLIVKSQENC